MKIHWRAGSRVWINRKARHGFHVPTAIALEAGNNEEVRFVTVRGDDGAGYQVDCRAVWQVKYTLSGGHSDLPVSEE